MVRFMGLLSVYRGTARELWNARGLTRRPRRTDVTRARRIVVPAKVCQAGSVADENFADLATLFVELFDEVFDADEKILACADHARHGVPGFTNDFRIFE